MENRRTIASIFLILVLLLLGPLLVDGQQEGPKVFTWEDNLYETVDYGAFACSETDKVTVNEFFEAHPLKRIIPVCHNNCAIMTSFPSGSLPPFKRTEGEGFVAIHILVNEKGRPIFARALNGRTVIRSFLERRGCNATFKDSDSERQKIVYVCIGDKCDEPQPVF